MFGWHVGGRVVNNVYEGGEVFSQIMDSDGLGYWCLLDDAKVKLKQIGDFKLYFKNVYNGDLVHIFDDATSHVPWVRVIQESQ